MRHIFLFIAIFFAFANAQTKNPIVSPTFDTLIKTIVGEEEYIFDDKNITVNVPNFADNPVQVPFMVDGSKITDAKRMVIFADLNPIPEIIDINLDNLKPIFSTNMKVAQETPLRVVIKDSKGLWHIGSANIKSNGGGCDVSSQASSNYEFAKLLGQTKGNIFSKDSNTRIKASVFHPMETGLVFGNIEFYINKVEIYSNDKLITTAKTTSAISENPRLTFETKEKIDNALLKFYDVDGNVFKLDLK